MPLPRTISRTKKVAGPRKDAAPAPPDAEQRILDAARRVFIRRGTAGARMQEIADEAGVNQALLHYYFRSKERLAERVFLEAAGRLFAAVVPALTADAPLEEKIERFVHRYIDKVREQPVHPGLRARRAAPSSRTGAGAARARHRQ